MTCNHDTRYYSETEGKCIYCEVKKLRSYIPELKGQADGRDTTIKRLTRKIAMIQDRLNDILENYKLTVLEPCREDELHCSCVPALKAEIEYLKTGKSIWRYAWSWEEQDIIMIESGQVIRLTDENQALKQRIAGLEENSAAIQKRLLEFQVDVQNLESVYGGHVTGRPMIARFCIQCGESIEGGKLHLCAGATAE